MTDLTALVSRTWSGPPDGHHRRSDSKAVDRLEAAGRCRRTANPHDRRSSLVTLTPEGERILAAARPTVEAELQTWLGSVLPADALENLAANLSMLRQRAEVDPRTDRAERPA